MQILSHQKEFHEALASCHRRFKAENHPTCGTIEGNIGTTYTTLGGIDEATGSFERSLALQKRFLPSGHYSLVTCQANLGHAYTFIVRIILKH